MILFEEYVSQFRHKTNLPTTKKKFEESEQFYMQILPYLSVCNVISK
jgi:hypothetical protein